MTRSEGSSSEGIAIRVVNATGGELPTLLEVAPIPVSRLPTYLTGISQEALVDTLLGAWLPEALDEVGDACKEAQEEGYAPVSDLARKNAENLLSELAERVIQAPMVHCTPEGGIAVDFRNPEQDAGVLIISEPDGEGVCFYEHGGKRGRMRCSDAGDLLEEAGGWHALARAGLTKPWRYQWS
ncbi:MAG: hypothetical protein IH999_10220 [Proteobacteria bacterium]|nr:hypothetical protein [Pseudomonadota bacterium]